MWRRPRWRRDHGFHVIQVRREKYTIEHAHCAGSFETKPLEKVPLTHLKLVTRGIVHEDRSSENHCLVHGISSSFPCMLSSTMKRPSFAPPPSVVINSGRNKMCIPAMLSSTQARQPRDATIATPLPRNENLAHRPSNSIDNRYLSNT